MADWKARTLSQVGEIVLVKPNLTGIPLFPMQGIKIPNCIAQEVDSVNRNFLLNNNLDSDNGQGLIPLILLDKMCRPKCEGELGIS